MANLEPVVPQKSTTDTTDPNSYRYQPLPDGKWIRVAAIQPYCENQSEPIHFNFLQVQLDDADHLQYSTVSYAWGGQLPTERVICEDRNLVITKTLLDALECLRKPNEVVHIWADAICIDQSLESLVERQSQVSMMDLVFFQAQCVFVHLGYLTPNELRVIKIIEQFASAKFEGALTEHDSMLHIYNQVRVLLAKHDLPDYDSDIWLELERLLARPWFTRLWIIQEYAVARRPVFVFSNGTQLDSDTVEQGITRASKYFTILSFPLIQKFISEGYTFAETIALWIPRFSWNTGWYIPMNRQHKLTNQLTALHNTSTMFTEICQMRKVFQERLRNKGQAPIRNATSIGLRQQWQAPFRRTWWKFEKRVFHSFYTRTHHFRATDYRDRIYSLRGMLNSEEKRLFDVDYHLPPARLAERLTLHLIERGHGVFALTHDSVAAKGGKHGWRCTLRNENPHSLIQLTSLIQPSGRFAKDIFRAGGYEEDIEIIASTSKQSPQISVAGVCIGHVDEICRTEFPELLVKLTEGWSLANATWWEGMKSQFQWYFDAVAWLDTLTSWMSASKYQRPGFELDCWRTLSCGLSYSAKGEHELIGSRPGLRDPGIIIMSCKKAYKSLWNLATTFLFQNVALPWDNIILSFGRRLATDTTGRPCVVPINSEPGDLVCLFKGFPLPFILRPTESGSYLLIGACYVHKVVEATFFEDMYRREGTRFILESGPGTDEDDHNNNTTTWA